MDFLVQEFQSALPSVGRDVVFLIRDDLIDISIHSPRMRERLLLCMAGKVAHAISIHSPHTRRDDAADSVLQIVKLISIHSPR